MESEVVRPVLRSWLAAHVSKVTGKPARFVELAGEVDDEYVPAWTYDMILLAGDSATVDSMTSALDRYPETVIPLANFFTMERPMSPERFAEGRSSGEPTRSPGDEGGYGICFDNATVWDISYSIHRAIQLYEQQERVDEIRKQIMEIDNSWEKSARIYINLYNS